MQHDVSKQITEFIYLTGCHFILHIITHAVILTPCALLQMPPWVLVGGDDFTILHYKSFKDFKITSANQADQSRGRPLETLVIVQSSFPLPGAPRMFTISAPTQPSQQGIEFFLMGKFNPSHLEGSTQEKVATESSVNLLSPSGKSSKKEKYSHPKKCAILAKEV